MEGGGGDCPAVRSVLRVTLWTRKTSPAQANIQQHSTGNKVLTGRGMGGRSLEAKNRGEGQAARAAEFSEIGHKKDFFGKAMGEMFRVSGGGERRGDCSGGKDPGLPCPGKMPDLRGRSMQVSFGMFSDIGSKLGPGKAGAKGRQIWKGAIGGTHPRQLFLFKGIQPKGVPTENGTGGDRALGGKMCCKIPI